MDQREGRGGGGMLPGVYIQIYVYIRDFSPAFNSVRLLRIMENKGEILTKQLTPIFVFVSFFFSLNSVSICFRLGLFTQPRNFAPWDDKSFA